MIISGNYIKPSEGYRYITNGVIWSEEVYIGKYDNITNWHDTNTEPVDSYEITEDEKEEALVHYISEQTNTNASDLISATEALVKSVLIER